MTTDNPAEAIEVTLRQAGTKIECTVTWLDEDTSDHDLESRSFHHAKREVRAWLARDGWVPVDRWSSARTNGRIVRHFRRPPANDRLFPLAR